MVDPERVDRMLDRTAADVAHHLIASEGWRVQESIADAVRRLGVEHVLTSRLAASVATTIGFRNVLVHQYADVDDARVLANLGLLEDLDEFVSPVAAWLGGP